MSPPFRAIVDDQFFPTFTRADFSAIWHLPFLFFPFFLYFLHMRLTGRQKFSLAGGCEWVGVASLYYSRLPSPVQIKRLSGHEDCPFPMFLFFFSKSLFLYLAEYLICAPPCSNVPSLSLSGEVLISLPPPYSCALGLKMAALVPSNSVLFFRTHKDGTWLFKPRPLRQMESSVLQVLWSPPCLSDYAVPLPPSALLCFPSFSARLLLRGCIFSLSRGSFETSGKDFPWSRGISVRLPPFFFFPSLILIWRVRSEDHSPDRLSEAFSSPHDF